MNPDSVSRQLSRVERPAQMLLALLLAVWLAWWIADTFWLMASGPSSPAAGDNMPVISVDSSARVATVNLDRIRAWEVFGQPGERENVVSVESAPDTRLRLELLGLFQHPQSTQAGAIIAEQGKEGELFRVGDRLPGNATLDEILADRVILLRAGQREALRLKEAELGGVASAPQTAQTRPRLDRRNMQSRPAAQVSPQDQTEALGLPEDASAQRQIIIQQMGLEPNDGEGYQIGAGAPRQILQQIGLRTGDVIVSVNGHVLGQEGSDLAALEEFRNTGTASIVVQRGAQRFTVNYPP
jgi:general secretion pathway protein C